VKRKGDKADQKFNLEIGALISKRLSDFDSMNDPEINTFRREIIGLCQEAIDARARGGERQMELYMFPPRIDESPLPKHIKDKLPEDKSIFIKVKIPASGSDGEMEFRSVLCHPYM
jgi:phosphatidylinositol-4,5-bisphosphate 3-kinase